MTPELLHLNSFLHAFFSPAAARAARSAGQGSQREDHAARADFVEAFAWLDLGVRAGIFPAEAATHVLNHYSFLLPGASDPFSASWAFLFPSATMSKIQAVLTTKEVFGGSPSWTIPNPPEFVSLLQLTARMAGMFVQDERASAFTARFVFATPLEFDEVMNESITSAQIAAALEGAGPTSGKAGLLAGFLLALRHMDGFTSLLGAERRNMEIDLGQWSLLRKEIASCHTWRVNLGNSMMDRRFQELANQVERLAQDDARTLVGVELHGDGFLEFVNIIRDRWAALSRLAQLSQSM